MGLFTAEELEAIHETTGGVRATCPLFSGDGSTWGALSYDADKDTDFGDDASVYGEAVYFRFPAGRLLQMPVDRGTRMTVDGVEYVVVAHRRTGDGSRMTVMLGTV